MRVDLALLGFGNVGRRFARLLVEQRERLLQQYDLDWRIVGISTRRHGSAFSLEGIDAIAAASLVEQEGSLHAIHNARGTRPPMNGLELIDLLGGAEGPLRVVLEMTTLDISAGRPAIDHVSAALACGCDVASVNKGPAAFAYHELQAEAKASGRWFLFEGAVMDGVPVFNLVRETLPSVEILGFRGVVNSTTNHILTALEDGQDFAPALARMQEEGIAEADPSLDVDGWDAAAKAAALANALMDARITPHDVRRTGIGPHTAAPARAAKSRGRRLRLVAAATRGQQPIVEPIELPEDDLLAGLRGTANALILETDLLGQIAIYQLSGSLTQTAYALLSDLITIRRRQRARPEAPARQIP
jgi:homoserine dehydrogenase